MHPVISRFLDMSVARATFEKAAQAMALDPAEQAFIDAANRLPKSKAAVAKSKGSAPHPEAQQHLIVLATEAATATLANDPAWAPQIERAMQALKAEGAEEATAHHLVAQAVLEEAFGYADDPSTFDAAFLKETFDNLVPLAKVTADLVDDWVDAYAKRVEAGQRPLRVKLAEALLDAAWDEGPQPISVEHVDDALDALALSISSAELLRATEHLTAFLGFLAEQKIIGPERLTRLVQVVQSAATGDGLDEKLEEEEDPEDEEDGEE